MSNIFMKNDLKILNNLDTTEVSSFRLPSKLSFNNKQSNYSETSEMNFSDATSSAMPYNAPVSVTSSDINSVTSSVMPLQNTVTSSVMPSQMGGNYNYSVTSSENVNANDINNLISMLTSESNNSVRNSSKVNKQYGGYNQEIDTELLENKLYSMLKKQKGGKGNEMAAFGLGAVAGAAGLYYLNNRNATETATETATESSVNASKIINPTAPVAPAAPVAQSNPIIDTETSVNSATSSDVRLNTMLQQKPNELVGGGVANPSLRMDWRIRYFKWSTCKKGCRST